MAEDASLHQHLIGYLPRTDTPSEVLPALRLLRNLVAVRPALSAELLGTFDPQLLDALEGILQAHSTHDESVVTAAWQLLANLMAGGDAWRPRLWNTVLSLLASTLAEILPHYGPQQCAAMIVYNYCLHEASALQELADKPERGLVAVRRALLLMERTADSPPAEAVRHWSWLLADLLLTSAHFGAIYNALAWCPADAQASVSLHDAAPSSTRTTLESAEGVHARTVLLRYAEVRSSPVTAEDSATLQLHVSALDYLSERLHLLCYLAGDLDWWRDNQHGARHLQLALIVRLLANICGHAGDHVIITTGSEVK